jgi:hypothetical protein
MGGADSTGVPNTDRDGRALFGMTTIAGGAWAGAACAGGGWAGTMDVERSGTAGRRASPKARAIES